MGPCYLPNLLDYKGGKKKDIYMKQPGSSGRILSFHLPEEITIVGKDI